MEKAMEEKETWLEIIVGAGHHSKVIFLQKLLYLIHRGIL
jgi:hypothetical protein